MWLRLFCLFCLVISALCCVPCKEVTCERVPNNCPVGVTKDPCGCCGVCAKNINEMCGGPHNSYGTCGIDLACLMDNFSYDQDPRDSPDAPIGICIKARRLTPAPTENTFEEELQ